MTVTPDVVAAELGRATPTDETTLAQWEGWIGDALLLIRHRLGDLDALDQDALDYVVRQAVAAHVRRPTDETQVAVSVEDGSVSRTYRSAQGRVTILDEWWELLAPSGKRGKAFSVTPGGGGQPIASAAINLPEDFNDLLVWP